MPRRLTVVVAAGLVLAGCAEFRDLVAPRRTDVAAIAAIAPAAGRSAEETEAVHTIETLADRVGALLGERGLAKPARAERLRALLGRAIDIPLIARFTLGEHWRSATPAQRAAYLEAFTGFILTSYSRQIGGAAVTDFAVAGATTTGRGDVMVESRIGRANGGPVSAVWRLRKRDGAFRIIDLAVGGVSLALTRRQEFAAVLRAGDLDGLIARLRDHAA